MSEQEPIIPEPSTEISELDVHDGLEETPDVAEHDGARTRRGKGRRENRPKKQKPFTRFATVTWSAEREPTDSMYWCEAEKNGEWLEIVALEQVRTRREILERLIGFEGGLVGLDFGFSFPRSFLEFLKGTGVLTNGPDSELWRSMIRKVREELKKNADDGVRVWIDRVGKYRESSLEPDPAPIIEFKRGRFGRESVERAPYAYEQRSMAERYRKAELPFRRAAEGVLQSTLQISYNRLTSRYEMSDARQNLKRGLLGKALLEQLLEAREDVGIWPWRKSAKLEIVELFPWIFHRAEGTLTGQKLRTRIASLEDEGTEIPPAAQELIARNPDAQRAFFSLIGMINTESRTDHTIRPVRDYIPEFYSDPAVQLEGWLYGVGYRSQAEKKEQTPREARSEKKPRRDRPERPEKRDIQVDNQSFSESTEAEIPALPTAPEIEAAPDQARVPKESTAEFQTPVEQQPQE